LDDVLYVSSKFQRSCASYEVSTQTDDCINDVFKKIQDDDKYVCVQVDNIDPIPRTIEIVDIVSSFDWSKIQVLLHPIIDDSGVLIGLAIIEKTTVFFKKGDNFDENDTVVNDYDSFFEVALSGYKICHNRSDINALICKIHGIGKRVSAKIKNSTRKNNITRAIAKLIITSPKNTGYITHYGNQSTMYHVNIIDGSAEIYMN